MTERGSDINDYGFTKNPKYIAAAHAWREAAIADGWSARPTYEEWEPLESAARLTRDGFTVQMLTRQNGDSYTVSIHVWGPDGLAIKPPDEYSYPAIVAGVRTCNACDASDVETFAYSFAGRACAACLPAMREQHEKPGWAD